MDPASKLRLMGAAHDLSRAIITFAETQRRIRYRNRRHEDMVGQALIHLQECQKYLRHVLEDIKAEGFGDLDTVDPRD